MDGGDGGVGGGESGGAAGGGSEGGEVKVKRKMKTAFQLEVLEKTYAGLCFFYKIFYVFFLLVISC